MMLSYILSFFLAFFAIYFYLRSYINFCVVRWKAVSSMPGPPMGLVGNLNSFYTTEDKIFKLIRLYSRNYYPIFKFQVFHLIGINILEPEDCEEILSNMKHMKKSYVYNILHDWLKSGLLTSFGKKWQQRRKILTPTFHFSILQQFVNVFGEETQNIVEKLKTLACNQQIVEINEPISQFTLKSIAETAMGTKLNFNSKIEKDYKQSINEFGKILLYRATRTWFLIKPLFMLTPTYFRSLNLLKTLHLFTSNVISKREKEFSETKSAAVPKRMAMLDLLLAAKEKNEISHDGICEEVDTFMFEGHDTTAAALSFALMLLACNKNAQELILEEMKCVLGEDVHRKASMSELQEMRYLERCIKETLRLYPSVTFISRELGEDYTTKTGYFLPKGSICHIHIYDIHRNERFYPDPEKFDPDRFLPENVQDRHLFAYIPFSAGPRNCIGQRFAMLEMKSVICGILANFILEPIDTPETIVLQANMVVKTEKPIKVKFIPRT